MKLACLLALILPLSCATPDRPSSAPPGSWLAVLDKSDATLRILEPNSGHVKDVVPTGLGPHECAASPDGQLVVVCNYGDQRPGSSLLVWDLVERRVRATIDLAPHQRPHGIEFLSNRTVLVTSETSHAVLEVSLISEKVVRVLDTGAETSHMLSATPDKTRVFTANIRSGSISAIDLKTGMLIRCVPTGAEPEAIDVAPDGRELWVGHNGSNKLVVLDTHSLEVLAEMPCGELPIRLKCTVDGRWVLVSCAKSGEVVLIDRAARKEIARIPMPRDQGADPMPIGIVVESKGRYAYVALNGARSVAVIDIEKHAVVRTFATGNQPDGMAWIWRRDQPFGFVGDSVRFTP